MKALGKLFLFLLILVVAGCSGGNSDDSKSDEGSKDSNSGSSEETFELKLGHTGAPDHHYQDITEKFADLVAERTDGNVQIEVYPADQLGSQMDSVEGVMLGTQDMVLTSDTVLSNWTPDTGILNLPYIFEDKAHVGEILDSEIGEELSAKLEEHGAVNLAWWDNGFRNVSNDLRPIETPEDLEGLSIRVTEGEIMVGAFEALGALPQVISFGELYTALQLGTVDAQENPPAHLVTQKFYEVQEYASKTKHIYQSSPLIINKELLESMPEEYQEVMLSTAKELAPEHRQMVEYLEDEQWTELEEEHGMKINAPDLAPFKEKVQPFIEEWKEKLDTEIVEAILESR